MKRVLLWISCAVIFLLLISLSAGWWFLRGSLPLLDGQLAVGIGGPSAAVTIERDVAGAPTITGQNVEDVAYGLGFAHAQDRFFQMDLARRLAAGELAALIGVSAVPTDKKLRVFRFRAVAQRVVSDATPAQRSWVKAYTRGVNRGMAALRSRPWEYGVLRLKPQPWQAEDSILVLHSMWYQLQYQNIISEQARRQIISRIESQVSDASLTASVTQFLFARGNEWDTPNFQTLAQAHSANGAEPFQAPPIPSPAVFNLRNFSVPGVNPAVTVNAPEPESVSKVGSNAWVVSGRYTANGAALIAGDMHLGLRVPTVWYRARLRVNQSRMDNKEAQSMELNGVTLPGLPFIAAGSNGYIAWSFTNSYGNWVDVNSVSCDATQFSARRERIEVAHAKAIEIEIKESLLGTLIDTGSDASSVASTCWVVRWLAVEPGATNLVALELMQARDVEAALSIAPSVGMPQQNFIVGDRSGHIAWSIIGRIPIGNLGPMTPRPVKWRLSQEVPKIVDPEVGRLWSANARQVEGEFEVVLGNEQAQGGMSYDSGARVRQIRDDLLGLKNPATPMDMLNIQLDDRGLFLTRWQRLLLATLDEDALKNSPQRIEMRRYVSVWGGRADPNSVGYRIVREFRDKTRQASWQMITSALKVAEGSRPNSLFEGSLWRLVTEQPMHWLSRDYLDWRAFILTQVDQLADELNKSCGSLSRCRWGQFNTMQIRHPLSAALGPLGPYLDMPTLESSGDHDMPRVVGPTFGASERFAVSPGHEAEGYLQIPGVQSGHPLSPFYRTGFEDWITGRARPLLPSATVYRLTLNSSITRASE